MDGDFETRRDEEKLWITCVSRPLDIDIETLPPSTNHIWRNNGRGRVYKVLEASRWEEHAVRTTRQAAVKAYGSYDLECFRGRPLKFEIFVQRPTWRGKSKAMRKLYVRPDLDNFIKICCDALSSALNLDDSAIVEIVAKKVEGPKLSTFIRISFMPDDFCAERSMNIPAGI